jgi:hypothetical protein
VITSFLVWFHWTFATARQGLRRFVDERTSFVSVSVAGNARSAVPSIITGGGQWAELTIHTDPLYQHILLTAEKKFWGCVVSGQTPWLFRGRAA